MLSVIHNILKFILIYFFYSWIDYGEIYHTRIASNQSKRRLRDFWWHLSYTQREHSMARVVNTDHMYSNRRALVPICDLSVKNIVMQSMWSYVYMGRINCMFIVKTNYIFNVYICSSLQHLCLKWKNLNGKHQIKQNSKWYKQLKNKKGREPEAATWGAQLSRVILRTGTRGPQPGEPQASTCIPLVPGCLTSRD
jgi:hypothetical protein